LASSIFRSFPYELKRVASQNIASVDSVHRNIAAGYCRRSIKEYVQHLYVALGSLGESVSGFAACRAAAQLTVEDFTRLDELAFKLENGLLRLVQSLEQKRDAKDWIDTMVIRDCNASYDASVDGDTVDEHAARWA
jgi:four helix bundle protein